MNLSTLPNEILYNILKKLPNKDVYQCLFVCKRWLTAVQMVFYKELSINIGFTDNIFESLIFDTLVNSIYMPGRWVKKITVKRLKVPDNMFALDPNIDPLHLLITHCPFVEEFCFRRVNFIFQTEWQYLQSVLEKRKNTWKLRNLSKNFDKEDYDFYYSCSLTMKDTLRCFYLKKKQVDYKNHFKPFPHLTNLSIGTRVITDIVECDEIINHLPQLINLDAEFHVSKSLEVKKFEPRQIQISSTSFTTIKELQLKNFPLSRDEELLIIMQKFNALDIINIKLAKGKPWPITKISSVVLQNFFQFITNIHDYSIFFRDIDNVRVLKEYFASQEKHDGYFHIAFTSMLDEGEKATSLLISSQEGVKLTYNLVGASSEDRIKKANSTLYGIHRYIQHLHVSLLGKHRIPKRISILPLIFGSCLILNKLTFSGGELTENVITKFTQRQDICELTFNNCNLDLFAFRDTIHHFLNLNLLQLHNCNFINDERTDNATNTCLEMSDTDFNTIKLSFQEIGLPGVPLKKEDEFGDPLTPIEKNDVFIIVNLCNAKTTKYYCCDTFAEDMKTVTKNTYFEYLDQARKSEQYLLNIFILNVKSLKVLSLVTPEKYISCDIL